MINRKSVLAVAFLSLAAVASAKSYGVTLYDQMLAGGTELKPGEYTVDVSSDKAVIKKGKLASENPSKLETAPTKYASTSVVCSKVDGKLHIKEIHLGGTNTKVVFTEATP
jgi:hypothetical protein